MFTRIILFFLAAVLGGIEATSHSLNLRNLQSKEPRSFGVTLYESSSTCNGAASEQTLFIAQQFPFCQRQGQSSLIVACDDDSRSGSSTVCSDSFCSQNCLSERFISGACAPAGPRSSMRIECGPVAARPPPLSCGRCTIEYSELSDCIGPDRSFINVKSSSCTRNMDGTSFVVYPVRDSVGLDVFFCSDADCNSCIKQPLLQGQCINSDFATTGAGSLRASCASDCIAASASPTSSPSRSPTASMSMSSSSSASASVTPSSSTSMSSSSSASASVTPSSSTSMSSSSSASASVTPSSSTSMSSSSSASASVTPSSSTSMSSSSSASASATPTASTSMSSSSSASASATPTASTSMSSSSSGSITPTSSSSTTSTPTASSSSSASPSATSIASASPSSSASETSSASSSMSSTASSSSTSQASVTPSASSSASSSASQSAEAVPIFRSQPSQNSPYRNY